MDKNIIVIEDSHFSLVPYGNSARLDLSYKKINELDLKGLSFKHSLFTGAIISDITVENLDFSRCDFAGTIFNNCEFKDCTFSRSGFRSSQINKSKFYNCDLSLINFSDCNFNEVDFIETSFFNSRIKDSILTETNFYHANFESLGLILNQFSKCHFENTALGNCTVLLLEFNEVTFRKCKIAAESVGYIYGITKNNLEELSYLYLGENQEYSDKSNIINDFLVTYKDRKWPLAIFIHSINFGLSDINMLIEMYYKSLNVQMRIGGYLEIDELCFAIDIILKQFEKGNLGFKQMLNTYDMLVKVEIYLNEINGDAKKILYIKSILYEFIIEQYNNSSKVVGNLNINSTYTVTVTYKEKPKILLSELTTRLEDILHLPKGTILLNERKGSYIEIFSTLVGGLIGLHTLLFFTNKILMQIHKAQIIGNAIINYNKNAIEIINSKDTIESKEIRNILQKNISKLNDDKIIDELIKNQKEYGLDANNIQKIDVEENSEIEDNLDNRV